jgi:acetyl esterase/lipase
VFNAATIAAAALMTPGPPAGPVVDSNVAYATRGGQVLRMDVHRPGRPRPGGSPAIVWVHGGGFHSGTRHRMTRYARFFARRGWVAATIDYRLRSKADVRRHGYAIGEAEAQADAEAALRFLSGRADRLGIDRRRMVIGGASAGAITALNVAARAGGRLPVRAAVAFAGAGPVADIGPGDPPMLLVHGTNDRDVPFARAERTCAAALRAGVTCTLRRVDGAGHGALLARRDRNARRAAAWLRRMAVG